ncbi:MAG: DsbE family thiol:disulfide interchange protein [Rickettsiales bacterium]|nr:DsbE family thiol:disulfide interchange protein [Rickettsiales bacterium]
MRKFIQILPFITITIISGLLLVKLYSGKTEYKANSLIGREIPKFLLESLENKKISKKDFLGKYTILNFFSSWCVVCKVEHPIFMELKKIKTDDMQIIGIAWRDKKQDTKNWLQENGNPFDKIAFDSAGVFGIELGITGIPETFIIDKNAKVIFHHRGDIKPEFLLEVETLLEKKLFNEDS